MSGCDATRPRLGELLVGALEGADLDEALAHLDTCEACGLELAELQRLGEVLAEPALAAAPPAIEPTIGSTTESTDAPKASAFPDRSLQPFVRWKLWVGAAAAATLLVAAALRQAPTPRLIDGEVRTASLKVRAARSALAVPRTELLRVTERAVLELAQETRIYAKTGARLALLAPREVRLESGAASFAIPDVHTPFAVRTPHGVVRTLEAAAGSLEGTVFTVEVRETTMNSKTKAAAAAIVTVAVGAGAVLLSRDGEPSERIAAGQRVVAGMEAAQEAEPRAPAAGELAEAEAKNAELQAAARELTAARDALEQELEAARAELVALRTKPTDAPAPAAEAGRKTKLPVDYGRWAQLDALESADWRTMGGAMKAMLDLMPEFYETLAAGKDPSTESQIALGRENTKLLTFAIEVMGKLPTSVKQTGNGAFTHPVVFANILVEHLEQAGQPLTGPQQQQLRRLGSEYDAGWDGAQARYGDQTYSLQRLLDELTLKLTFYDGMVALLDPAQQAIVVRPAIQHRSGMDLYSPVLMLSGVARPLVVDSPEVLDAKLRGEAQSWGYSAEALAGQAEVFETWAGSLALTPVSEGVAPFSTLGDSMSALRAQLAAMAELELRLAPADSIRTKTRELTGFPVPRLVGTE